MKECKDIGVVLDYVFIKNSDNLNDQYEIHKNVAIYGMQILKERLENYFIELFGRHPELYNEEVIKIKIHEEDIFGDQVSYTTFWGANDYQNAFFEPPHGLSGTFKDQRDLFERINEIIFMAEIEQIEIYSWSDGWSNYFDDGKEWWGTYYWTIYNRGRGIYTVIAGSTTD